MHCFSLLDLDAHLASGHHTSGHARAGTTRDSAGSTSCSSVRSNVREDAVCCPHGLGGSNRVRQALRLNVKLDVWNPPPNVSAAVLMLDLAQLEYRPIRSTTLQRVFRFWLDELVVPGTGAKTVERVLLDLGGTKTGSPPAHELPPSDVPAPVLETLPPLHQLLLRKNLRPEALGCCNMSEWDLLWSSHYCALSAISQGLGPYQVVNALPGLWALSSLPKMLTQLVRCYGEAQAFEMMPRSFRLPQQLDQWLSWIRKNSRRNGPHEPSSSQTVAWLLKGRSTQPVPAHNVEKMVLQLCNNSKPCPAMVAQQYISNPLLVDGHKCHLQLWCLVTGTDPLRAYLHRNGLVCMATELYDPLQGIDEQAELTGGHNTRGAGPGVVWNLYQLKQLMGADTFSKAWTRMKEICAFLVSCSLSEVCRKQRELGVDPSAAFHLLGVHFMLDSTGQPWLVKVQGSPSLDVRHSNPGLMCLINDQKAKVVKDTLNLVVRRLYRTSAGIAEETPQLDSGLALAEKELQHLGGFEPLMPLFPVGISTKRIPWSKLDVTLRTMMDNRAQD